MASGQYTATPGPALPRDLGTFNRWLNLSRIRASVGVAVAVTALEALHPGTFLLPAVYVICTLSVAGSIVGLRVRALAARPARLFAWQTALTCCP
jgi:hypothetical protein